MDANSVKNKSMPTMVLGFFEGDHDYNTFIVVHEFGHALGMKHEHQRSKFWSIAKEFLDVNKIKRQFELLNATNIVQDYIEVVDLNAHGSLEYDPSSVMHYW